MPAADLIFTGGPVVSMDPAIGRADAVAVRGGRIAAVGNTDEITALRGPTTDVVNLNGRALLPGFVEAHSHPTQDQLLFTDTVVDIRPVTAPTAAHAHDLITRELATAAPNAPLIFLGLDSLLQVGFPEPTRARLDEWAGSRPVVVWHNSGHLAWANTAALRYAGVADDAPDPLGGQFERDDAGRITGKAYEQPAILAVTASMIAAELNSPGPLARQHANLASRGITTCADLGFTHQFRPLVHALYDQHRASVRMRVYETSNASGRSTAPLDNGDDLFRQVGIKVWVDGSPWVGNIATSFPYLDTAATAALGLGAGHRGHANYTADQLHDIIGAYYPAGWQIACHVHGDDGVDTILDVYADTLRRQPRPDHRLRLEHCGAMTAAQYRRAASLGVTCSLFIDHLHYWGDVLVDDLFGPEHGAVWMRARSALDAGVRISLHNDAPVTPEEPLRNMAVAVTRESRGGRILAPEERITIEEALRAQTIDAAYQLFADDVVGSLTPGKYADLVVLDADPRVVDPQELPDLPVHATYLAGILTHGG